MAPASTLSIGLGTTTLTEENGSDYSGVHEKWKKLYSRTPKNLESGMILARVEPISMIAVALKRKCLVKA